MSNDKLNDSLAVRPEFAAGEQPDHNKLSQAFIQIYGALNKVEGAVGPARDDNQALYQNRLNSITNLTRQVGPAHGPQPRIPPGSTVVATSQLKVGRKEWLCPVWPFDTNGGPNIVFNGQFVDENGADVFATELSYSSPLVAMTATGQWIYDYRDNSVKSFSKLATAGGTANFTSVVGIEFYSGLAALGIFGDSPPVHFGNASPNVIPNPLVSPATSVVVEESAAGSTGSYKVTINPEVTNYSYHNMDFDSGDVPVGTLLTGASDLTNEIGAQPFFNSTNLITQSLPSNFDTLLSSDDLIPKNILMLHKDASTQAYPELQYYYRDQTSFYVSGQTLSIGSGYRVLVPGADIGQTLENNQFYLQHHRHKGPNAIVHKTIHGRGYATDGKSLSTSSNVGWNRSQQRSVIKGNEHPQYLMRNGWSEGSDPENLDNAMLGPMVFGYNTNGYNDATNVAETSFPGGKAKPTHGIFFGQTDLGGDIRLDTGGLLRVCNYSGGGWLFSDSTGIGYITAPGANNKIHSLGANNDFILGYHGSGEYYAYGDNNYIWGGVTPIITLNAYNKVAVLGHDVNVVCEAITGVNLEVAGNQSTATATNCLNSHLYYAGTNSKFSLTSATNMYAVLLGDNLTHAIPSDTDTINGNAVYAYCSSFAIDADYKYVTKAIAPTDWYACNVSADGAMSQPGLYQDIQSIIEGGVASYYATSPTGSSFLTFLHLPPDAHLYSIEPHIHCAGAIVDILECSPTDTEYKNVKAQTLVATGNYLESTGLRFTVSTGVRQGHRYPTLGWQNSHDVALRIRNTSITGMTAAMCLYTYKLMRL